jgi:hypothetical protein
MKCRLWSSGLWCVGGYSVLKEVVACVFKWHDVFIWNVGDMASQPRRPQPYFHHSGNLKSDVMEHHNHRCLSKTEWD